MSRTIAERLKSVKQMAQDCPALKESTLRYLIFNAESLGLGDALVRIGSRVLFDTDRFDAWLEMNRGPLSAAR